nr:CoA pyrophosphatase [Kineosphaera limosa]
MLGVNPTLDRSWRNPPPGPVGEAVDWFRTFSPPARPERRSAVLVLFGPRGAQLHQSAADPPTAPDLSGYDVLLTERAHTLRSHAAQVVCPGGHIDPGDDGPVHAALREASEEVGLDPATVDVVGELPSLYLHPSGTAITPVLGWWRQPHPVSAVDRAEVAHVVRADLGHLLAPANRFTVVAPMGFRTAAFETDGLVVWGFTANLLANVFALAGIDRPWDQGATRPLPDHLAAAYWNF